MGAPRVPCFSSDWLDGQMAMVGNDASEMRRYNLTHQLQKKYVNLY